MTKTFLTIIVGLSLITWSCNSTSGKKETTKSNQPKGVTDQKATTPNIPIHQAAFEGNLDELKNNLRNHTNVDLSNEDGHTPLMLAAFNGHTDAVRILIDKGASVQIVDKKGLTPLHFAASGPFPETVEVLLKNGANINAIDSLEHFTPLMYAAAEGNTDVVKILLKHGADKNLKDVDGDTAANFARKNKHTEIVELLK